MAATKDMSLPQRTGEDFGYPAKAGLRYYKHALLAATAAGLAVPAGHVDAVAIAGLVDTHVDNRDGVDGAQNVVGRRGIFGFGLAATPADIDRDVYAVDDGAVSFDGSGGRLVVGKVVGIGGGRTWVDVAGSGAAGQMLTPLDVRIATLVGVTVTRTVSPVPGRIRKIWSVTDGVLTTGNATITAAINGVAVTNGVVTITQAGSAAGDVDFAVPTAANLVAAGDVISLTVGGTNATATPATVILEIVQ